MVGHAPNVATEPEGLLPSVAPHRAATLRADDARLIDRSNGLAHLTGKPIDVGHVEAAVPGAWQASRTQKTTIRPVANGVLVDPETTSGLADVELGGSCGTHGTLHAAAERPD
jgi:hypothetical protein